MIYSTKAKLRKAVNKAVSNAAPGIFSDEYWHGYNQVVDALSKVPGIEYVMQGSRYRHSEGKAVGKEWLYQITDGKHEVFLQIIASGAGSVSDPLSRYDIIAYAN